MPTPMSVALPGGQTSHPVLVAFFCFPAGQERQWGGVLVVSIIVGYGHSSQLELCLLGRLPFAHAAQRLPLDDTSTPLHATLQQTHKTACDAPRVAV